MFYRDGCSAQGLLFSLRLRRTSKPRISPTKVQAKAQIWGQTWAQPRTWIRAQAQLRLRLRLGGARVGPGELDLAGLGWAGLSLQ